ncbi:Membrane protein, putative precursor (fragment) (modular protein) [Xenorhabdus bovienii str. Intermedium]|uniref:Membrane protein, putative (Modular protein) n=1 Tax=Xenorhabdus bovienii str. Intermedium TaxID=1379677 RepID=A0A077QPB1_XENBV
MDSLFRIQSVFSSFNWILCYKNLLSNLYLGVILFLFFMLFKEINFLLMGDFSFAYTVSHSVLYKWHKH